VLFIYDGMDNTAPLLASLNGNALPGSITSTGNKVFVEFITDNENTAAGFYLNYKAMQPVWCSGMTTLTAPAAVFDDGSGSFYYYNNLLCRWSINPGTNMPLTLHFNYFDTEPENDVVKIYDHVGSGVLVATLSGFYEVPPEPVTASSGKMLVIFTTNKTVQGLGWEAWYDITSGITEPVTGFGLQIYPNPSETGYTVCFGLEEPGEVKIQLIDMMGRDAIIPFTGMYARGENSVFINVHHLPSGVYFLILQTGEKSVTRKMVKY
jgi:hypothetical protein